MTNFAHLMFLGAVCVLLAVMGPLGCGDDDDEGTEKLGTEGESCTESADCEAGLSCVDLVCVKAGDAGDTPTGGTGGGEQTGGTGGKPIDKDSGYDDDAGWDKDGGWNKDGGDPFACKDGETIVKNGVTWVCVDGKWTEQ